MDTIKEHLLSSIEKYADSTRSRVILALVAFSEASFFLIPPDVFLVAILLYVPHRWVTYSSITTIFSVLGGVFGYAIGYFLFDAFGEWVLTTYNLVEDFAHVQTLYANNAFISVFVSAFTPIPYKVFTIAAGVFKINFLVFVIASVLGRGIRFFVEGYAMKHFGERAHDFVVKYFNILSLVVVFLVLLIFLI